ncbi:MAG: class I SAM-dependent methyltransferase [Caulobacterales bacterium]
MIVPRVAQTTAAVAAHYDDLDRFYREIWGEHLHHGYWTTGRETVEEAVEALVDLMAERLQLAPGLEVCDIGCGYGATAQRLAERWDVGVTGLTVSPVQAERARARRPASGRITILEQDWLANGFADAAFDRAYSVESSEHMPDKQRFFDEAFRTLKPGGLLAVYAWLARDDPKPWEAAHLLEPICREGRLPGLGDVAEYRAMAEQSGFSLVSFEDISRRVRRTWSICIQRGLAKLAADPVYRRFVLDGGAKNRVFALTLFRMMIAFRTGSLRYGLFVYRKPA